jgi:hypothetical protein
MTSLSSTVFLLGLALWVSPNSSAGAQQVEGRSASVKPQLLSLDFTNNGQHLAVTVGQRIEITLGTVGPNQYGDPLVSSPAIRLDSVALAGRPNPGGARYIYMFDAAGEGEAQVKFPYRNFISQDPDLAKRLTFTVTIHVRPGVGKATTLQASLTPDQANTAPWTNAWINVHSLLQQTFTPSLPTLTGVEVELVAVNPGPGSAEVSMAVMRRTSDRSEDVLADVSKTVTAADCGHVLFLLPKDGLHVSPGRVYSIALRSVSSNFGWKYVRGGYANGTASFQGFDARPLSPDTRSTFLFRTFGTS